MEHSAGLDVSVKETSVCIVDDAGKVIREVKVASEPEALLQVLLNPAYHFKRIGLEAGPLSQWLFSALAEAGLPVICVETRHMRAVLKAQINKTDRNDARGIAQMMRAGLYRPVHVKTLRSQKLRMLRTRPTSPALSDAGYFAKRVTLSLALRSSGLRVEVLGGAERRRRWSQDDKTRIVEETLVPGAKVTEVARRNGVAASVVFTWRRQARTVDKVGPCFTPVQITASDTSGGNAKLPSGNDGRVRLMPTARTGLIEIDLGNRRRIRVDAQVDPEALARVLDVLERR